MDAGFFRGTNLEQDARFSDKEKKLMKNMKFDPILNKKVDMSKVNVDTIKPWAAQRIVEILGFEDDVLIEYLYEMLEGTQKPNPHKMQIQLTGFLNGKNAREFMKQLWELLVSAQQTMGGVPSVFLELKKQEILEKRNKQDQLIDSVNKDVDERQIHQITTAIEEAIKSTSSSDKKGCGRSQDYEDNFSHRRNSKYNNSSPRYERSEGGNKSSHEHSPGGKKHFRPYLPPSTRSDRSEYSEGNVKSSHQSYRKRLRRSVDRDEYYTPSFEKYRKRYSVSPGEKSRTRIRANRDILSSPLVADADAESIVAHSRSKNSDFSNNKSRDEVTGKLSSSSHSRKRKVSISDSDGNESVKYSQDDHKGELRSQKTSFHRNSHFHKHSKHYQHRTRESSTDRKGSFYHSNHRHSRKCRHRRKRSSSSHSPIKSIKSKSSLDQPETSSTIRENQLRQKVLKSISHKKDSQRRNSSKDSSHDDSYGESTTLSSQ